MTTKKVKSALPADKLSLYDKLIASHAKVKRKGATLPYTSINGHMFSFLSASGSMALRLPAEARAAFLLKYKTTLFKAHGALLKEYVKVSESLLKKTGELKKYLDLSYEYVKSLKPKPQKKSGTAQMKE